jgi:hypothetical protein
VISLDDGPLGQALFDWTPPSELKGDEASVAEAIDQALEGALAPSPDVQARSMEGDQSEPEGAEGSLLQALLSRTGALSGLAEALDGLPLQHPTVRVGEDLRVGAGETLEGTVILVDGDLDVEGTIRGDVVVSGGTVRLLETGSITGDLRVADGTVERMGGSVGGSILDLDSADRLSVDRAELQSLREELESEIRRDVLASVERDRRHSRGLFSGAFEHLTRTIAGLLEDLVTFLILAVLGVLAVHFQRERLEIVATTIRKAPARAAVVGLAGGFLLLPVWIIGMVALAISIVGIPVLLAWIPLFPIAAGLAGLLGYLAIARNVGEWVADQDYKGFEWIRGSNTFYTVVAGLGALMLPYVAASAVGILGIGFFTGLLTFVGSAITFVALAVGFGAVLLTRGGKIRPYEAYYEFDEEFWPEPDYAGPSVPEEEEERGNKAGETPADSGRETREGTDAESTPKDDGPDHGTAPPEPAEDTEGSNGTHPEEPSREGEDPEGETPDTWEKNHDH